MSWAPHFLDLLEQGRAKESLGEITGFAALNNLDDMEAVRKFTNGLAAYFQVGRSADGSISVRKNCLSSDFVTANAHDLAFPQPFRTHLLNMQYRDILHTKLPRILKACDRVFHGIRPGIAGAVSGSPVGGIHFLPAGVIQDSRWRPAPDHARDLKGIFALGHRQRSQAHGCQSAGPTG